MLPKLAEIFQITTDELLGRSHSCAEQTEPIGEDVQNYDTGFKQNPDKYGSICFGIFALAVGALYLLSQIFSWGLSFWDILWPTTVLSIGVFGLLRKFSFFSLGCTLVGGYSLCARIFGLQLDLNSGILFAILILLFGISLLVDTLRKKNHFHFSFPTGQHEKRNVDYDTNDHTFECSGSFCSFTQIVTLELLERGNISNSFGEMAVDLSGVQAVSDSCKITASCSFGELRILVPRQYQVKPIHSTSFAEFRIDGRPDEETVGKILLDIRVSFGEAVIIYV